MLRQLERVAAPPPEWLERPERGSVAAIRLAVWLMLKLGRPASRLLLYPICAYFVLFSRRARRASAGYLRRVLGRRGNVFRHYHTFAATILDRLYFLAGRYGEFDITMHASEETQALLRSRGGCILLGSHLGSFEALRARSVADGVPPVNMLMYVDNAGKMNGALRSLAPEIESRIIPLGNPDSLLRVHECLARGEIVGILGDRAWRNERTWSCEFLGAPARFPLGPLLLAGLLQAPVVLCFGLYRGGRRYEIHLERFADAVTLDRREREASVRPWVERYARRLEHHCRAAPYNWFNFYDYWA
jgi:predicted LPLAT superfamily acyltransferase